MSLTIPEKAIAPAIPSPGYITVYADAAGALYTRDATGTTAPVDAGGSLPVSGERTWVDPGFAGTPTGQEDAPYPLIQDAVDAVSAGETAYIEVKSPGGGSPYTHVEAVVVEGKSIFLIARGPITWTSSLEIRCTAAEDAFVQVEGFTYVPAVTLSDDTANVNASSLVIRGVRGQQTQVASVTETRAVGVTALVLLDAIVLGVVDMPNTGSLLVQAIRARFVSDVTVDVLGYVQDSGVESSLTYVSLHKVMTDTFGVGHDPPSGLFGLSKIGSGPAPAVLTYAGATPDDAQWLPISQEAARYVREITVLGGAPSLNDCALLPITGVDDGLFGSGADGPHTVAFGPETLNGPKEYTDLTVPAGEILKTAGWPIYVSGELTVEGSITAIGDDAVTTTQGVGGGEADAAGAPIAYCPWGQTGGLAGGTTGNDGQYPETNGTMYGAGGAGGAGGNHSATGVGGDGGGANGHYRPIASGWQAIAQGLVPSGVSGAGLPHRAGGGGGGGGGVNPGSLAGAGGGGGGAVVLVARKLRCEAGGVVDVSGGAGGDATGASNAGGGGGGGGGVVCIAFLSVLTPANLTTTLTGGAGGAADGGGVNGSVGSAGTEIIVQVGGNG